MVTLQQVMERLEREGVLRPAGSYDGQREISQVELLGRHTVFRRDTLYLCPRGERPPESVPAGAEGCLLLTREEGGALSTVLAEGDWCAQTVYLRVRDILEEEVLLQDQINRMYGLLSASGGLKAVVQAAEDFLHCPISVCDVSYNLIETSPLMRRMSYGIKRVQSKLILDGVEIESLKRLQIEQQIFESHRAFVVDSEDHPDNRWIFCAIRLQGVVTGYVAVCLAAGAEITELDLRFTTALAGVCSVEMQKHDFFVTRTGMKYENFLVELLEGRFDDVNLISSRLELLDRKFCRYFCIAVLHCSEPHDSTLFNKHQMSALRAMYPNSMSVVYQDAIVLFLNQDEPILLQERQLAPLREFARRNRMKVGISQPFQDILKINAFYGQTRNALKIGEEHDPDSVVYLASELLPQYLFSTCPPLGLEVGIHHHIFWLQNYDQRYHTEFVHTLRTYLECGRSASRAAQALHLHRSTFFYRIKKLEELLAVSLEDSGLLFLYELSFRIWDYLSK